MRENDCSTVLIVDDSESIRALLKSELEQAGYSILTAENGKEALELVSKNNIKLILCDVMMPVMDGLQFVHEIKSNPQYEQCRFTPVIMLTSVTDENRKWEGHEAGARAWINKPIQVDRLLKVVSRFMPD